MMFRVFHAVIDDTADNAMAERNAYVDAMMGNTGPALDLWLYREVAQLEAESLDQVFGLTNHIDHAWTENPEIIAHAKRPRSTSVGDMVITETSGSVHACASFGWTELNEAQTDYFLNRVRADAAALDQAPQDPDF